MATTINKTMNIGRIRDSEAQAGGKINGNLATTTVTTTATTYESLFLDSSNGAIRDPSDHLKVLDSRTGKVYNIPISDGFVRGSDLSTIKAPIHEGDGRLQPLAVLDPGFQHTACKESSITLM